MKKLFIVALVVIVAGVVYFGFNFKDKLANDSPDGGNSKDTVDISMGENLVVIGEPDPVFAKPITYSSLNQIYNSANFSFKYPDKFKAMSNFISPTEEIVTVENPDGSGFQIYIIPWDEPGPITPERIWEDLPEADVLEPKNALLDDVKTLVFYGYNGDMGETFEAWTVYKGKLYQIAGPKTAEKLITETLETWDWK